MRVAATLLFALGSCGGPESLPWAVAVEGAVVRGGLPSEVQDRATGVRLVLIPAGAFSRGLPDSEVPPDADTTEDLGTPAAAVRLTKSFYLGKYEVTQEEWERVMGSSPSKYRGERYPITRVSWWETKEFCRRTGFRLPTEAEWERACKFGRLGAGLHSNSLKEEAWCGTGDNLDQYGPKPVGLKQPNALGLHDMLGNVLELCEDWWQRYPRVTDVLSDPTGPKDGKWKVARGGSWVTPDMYTTCVSRTQYDPTARLDHLGFRVARDP